MFSYSTGLVHVTGSFAMTDSYQLSILGTHETDYLSGTYDAVLSMDGTAPRCSRSAKTCSPPGRMGSGPAARHRRV
jgi:hypothetical protein